MLFCTENCLAFRFFTRFGNSVVLLSLSDVIVVILSLGHIMTPGGTLVPSLAGVSSTVQVEFGVVHEFSGLCNISLVVGILLLGLFLTDLGVLGSSQSSWDVRIISDGSLLELCEKGFMKEGKRSQNKVLAILRMPM